MKKISFSKAGGVAFPDFIRNEKRIKHKGDYDEKKKPLRDFFLPLICIVIFTFLFIKLVDLQVFKSNYYRLLSDSNRTKTNIIHAPRGIIFDRNAVPLVFNTPGFRKTENGKTIFFERKTALFLIAQSKDLEVDSLREYPYKDEISHVLGFIGQISKEEIEKEEFKNYNIKDVIGKEGIEKQYENLLRGKDGKELVEVDSFGKTLRTLGNTEPIPGQDIKLTLDLNIQRASFVAMQDVKKGAVIVSKPNGEILALLSKPSFDANLFTLGESYKTATVSGYQEVSDVLMDGQNQPLLNRAISGTYPPGSTFKIITSAAALEENKMDENFKIEDTGVLQVGAFSYANWYWTKYGRKEGSINIVDAIKRSNDIFFYKTAEMVGVDKLSEMGRKFGLGSALGIDIEGEARGIVPDQKWKKENIGEGWYLGDTYHYGIGQGFVLTTPLQVNAWTQVISNKGTLYQPRLLLNSKLKIQNSKFLSDKTISLIRQGMIESCSTGGVAWPLFEFKVKNEKLKVDGKNFLEAPQSTQSANFKDYRKISIACKTGTAEQGGPTSEPHAWITLFAPAYNPEIVVTVLVEEGGEGSNVAAPIAKKILEFYFEKK